LIIVGNIISADGIDVQVDMSNGGTDVFVEVMMLAVSALARHEWDFRFAARIARMDQTTMGRGVVGFDLAEFDWGANPAERNAAKDFVLRGTDLALRRHRWDELGYEPPFAERYLRAFHTMVTAFDTSTATTPDGDRFLTFEELVVATCVRHRVLAPLPWYRECVFCTNEWG
jgi:hypothetical protein